MTTIDVQRFDNAKEPAKTFSVGHRPEDSVSVLDVSANRKPKGRSVANSADTRKLMGRSSRR